MTFRESLDVEYDVLVVGAGPAGIKTAWEAKKNGAGRVLLIDRKQEIGAPVRCGEALSRGWMNRLGIKPKSNFCIQKVEGCLLFSPKGKRVEARTREVGYVMDRKIFEKEMAKDACRAGVDLWVKTMADEVIKENGKIAGVRGISYGENFSARAKITVAADGVDSRIARMAGINTTLPLTELDTGFEYEMIGIDLVDPTMLEMYFGNEVAPRGYVWVFPKGKDTANVGVGITGMSGKNPRYYLDKFIREHKDRFGGGSILEAKAGVVPVGGFEVQKYSDGLLLVGDAARQVNPIHGGGMGISMEAGMLAGEIIGKALRKGDYSAAFLKQYEDRWWKGEGKYLHKTLKLRRLFEKLTDEQFEIIADLFVGKDIYGLLFGTGLIKAGMKLLRKDPKLAKDLMSIARG